MLSIVVVVVEHAAWRLSIFLLFVNLASRMIAWGVFTVNYCVIMILTVNWLQLFSLLLKRRSCSYWGKLLLIWGLCFHDWITLVIGLYHASRMIIALSRMINLNLIWFVISFTLNINLSANLLISLRCSFTISYCFVITLMTAVVFNAVLDILLQVFLFVLMVIIRSAVVVVVELISIGDSTTIIIIIISFSSLPLMIVLICCRLWWFRLQEPVILLDLDFNEPFIFFTMFLIITVFIWSLKVIEWRT